MAKIDHRAPIEANQLTSGSELAAGLEQLAALDGEDRESICRNAARLVTEIRETSSPGLMEVFLAEYGLSTNEGIALMCLAEALLRVPDAQTMDTLIEDKIAPSAWGKHLGHSSSPLVNASTWGLLLTGKVLAEQQPGPAGHLRNAIKRLGEPVIRRAVARAMQEMGRQFVLGEDIKSAMGRAAAMNRAGFTYSYDMLGEAARTDEDARQYYLSYSRAISTIATACTPGDVAQNPGISVKLSALHARYEEGQKARVMEELVPRLRSLALLAKSAHQGFNIDAEEADRLSISLDVIEAVVGDPALARWDGFGVVVQAYGPRAGFVLDWLYDLAKRNSTRIMVRLVKGAYWDAEIKRAQVLGLRGFPVFTSKSVTDVSYIANGRKLLSMTDRIYPQFATHNAHTVQAILHMAKGMNIPGNAFEFQRLHGMGEELHKKVMAEHGTRCRIYAPVGAHADLLAYLVRRLLENGANSSFVNQMVDKDISAETVASDPFGAIGTMVPLPAGPELFAPERSNSRGWDLSCRTTLSQINAGRAHFRTKQWSAAPILVPSGKSTSKTSPRHIRSIHNPAIPGDLVGTVTDATVEMARCALLSARRWRVSAGQRAAILRKVAAAYETHTPELFALLHREAGKNLFDAVGEVREAVDFLHYYAAQIEATDNPGNLGNLGNPHPRGIWACISPWNFPLAIFTGQISAALAAGNAVVAKPAEQTCLIAQRAVELVHDAGVPVEVLQFLPGTGAVGAALTGSALINGVAFTGSTGTARSVRKSMAANAAPGTPLIAETGGLNAMVVDSTALPEHTIRDILESAFQSAGQRCSALRCLYLQRDVKDRVLPMLFGAMDELCLGNPWDISTDVGPVIDNEARKKICGHIEQARTEGRVLHNIATPGEGSFIAPTVIEINGIADLKSEIFGPVLHVAIFEAEDLPKVLEDINATGFGLTFGVHTRIDDRVQQIVETIRAGNIYVNRNQIGAVVGSQPFGGEGLSGTGPKAGGPHYLPRFLAPAPAGVAGRWKNCADAEKLRASIEVPAGQAEVACIDLPGPTGESNRLSTVSRPPVLCLGPGPGAAKAQAKAVGTFGGNAIEVDGSVAPELLRDLPIGAAIWWGDALAARAFELALAARDGPIVALITARPDAAHVLYERHVCIDTTASGGNAALLAAVSGAKD